MRNVQRAALLATAISFLTVGCLDRKDEVNAAASPDSTSGESALPIPAPDKDVNYEFLRMVSDHHEGLVQMSMAAMAKATDPTTKSDAQKVREKQAAERDSIVAILQRDYRERHSPTVTARSQAQLDSLAALTGKDYDRAYYRSVIEHHRDGIAMIDQQLPRLTNTRVHALAAKMKADQQREITEFEGKRNRL